MVESLEKIRNFVALDDRIGTAGQPRADQFASVADAGYELVINLAMPDHEDSIDQEGSLVSALGMTYIHIPVPFDAPNESHLSQFLDIMQANRDRKVFVHCIMNYRVSAFIYHYYQRVEGRSEADSRSPMFGRWEPDAVWQSFIDGERIDRSGEVTGR